jgi:predicted MFS family arabinose efflux permease
MSESVGYLALLRRNFAFRRLWYSQVVSQLGDWFDSIALYTLVYQLTGSGQAIGALMVAQFLPSAVLGLWAGILVDRLPRKTLMLAADIGRAVLVLAFLLVREPDQIWIIYLVAVLKMSLTALFEPARMASISSVAAREELIAANAIGSATWSAMLAIGAALGGLVAGTLGTQAAFLIDSGSFLVSAALIWKVPIREQHLEGQVIRRQPLQELREGFTFLLNQRDLAIYALCKALWSLGGGGVLLLLTVFGRGIFPIGVEGALSIGLLYAARGLGAGIGPIVAQRFGGSTNTFLRRMIGPAFVMTGLGYIGFSAAPSLWIAALCVLFAHAGGSIQWTYSTVLLQQSAPHRLQGRVFSVELALLTLATSSSSYLAGVAVDALWEPRTVALVLAFVFIPPGLWLAWKFWPSRT